jgi:hypothetical protein
MSARGRRQCGRTPARPADGKRCTGGVTRQPPGRTASPHVGVLRPDVGIGWTHAGRRPGPARAPGRPRHLTAGFLTVPLADPYAVTAAAISDLSPRAASLSDTVEPTRRRGCGGRGGGADLIWAVTGRHEVAVASAALNGSRRGLGGDGQLTRWRAKKGTSTSSSASGWVSATSCPAPAITTWSACGSHARIRSPTP